MFDRLPIVYKLAALLTGLIVICMSFLGAVIIHNQSKLLRAQIQELGTSLAEHMAISARDPLLTENILSLEVMTTSLASGKSVMGTAIFSEKGEILSRAGLIPGVFEQLPAINPRDENGPSAPGFPFTQEQFGTMLDDKLFGMPVISFISPILFKDVTCGYSLITFSRAGMDNALWQSLKAIVGATLLTILLGILLAYLLSHRVSQPIHHMTKAIRNVSEGSFDFRFSNKRQDEIGQLMTSFNEMAEGMLKKAQVENALSRYLSPKVAKEVTANLESIKLGGRRAEGSVLFADIVGFTKMSEKYPPEEIANLLNLYFSLITKACELNRGMVDKYMGDCAMMVFGVPDVDNDHCIHAITCALLIQRLIQHANQQRGGQGLPPIQFRMGLNTGTMLAGNMGSQERLEYTVVGDSVNLASRLCSVADPDQIIISLELYNRPEIMQLFIAEKYRSIKLRGKEYPVSTYNLTGAREKYSQLIEQQYLEIIQGSASSSQ